MAQEETVVNAKPANRGEFNSFTWLYAFVPDEEMQCAKYSR
jgi:hypothetical protein